MAKETHKGGSPKNARIKINYEGKKPIVRFSYPAKKHQFEGSMFHWIIIAWLILLWPITIGFEIDSLTEVTSYEESSLYLFTECALQHSHSDNKTTVNWTLVRNDICKDKIDIPLFPRPIRNMGFILLAVFGPPSLFYFPFRKFWRNVFPKWQGFLAKKKVAKFKPEDVKYDKEFGWYCEITLFENIILNFEATKEFSKYLKELEIREHKFKLYHPRKKKARTWKGKYQPPKTFNEWIWYARFYFKAKPTTGKLEVLFK